MIGKIIWKSKVKIWTHHTFQEEQEAVAIKLIGCSHTVHSSIYTSAVNYAYVHSSIYLKHV